MVKSQNTPVYLLLFIFIFICGLKRIENAKIPKVTSPPSIKKQPLYEQVYQVAMTQDEKVNPFILECEADGDPEPE